VSDYTAIPEMIQHGYAADPEDAARKALLAGVDMEMVSTTYFDHVKRLLDNKKLDIKTIDDSVRHILVLKYRLGLFEQTPPPPLETTQSQQAKEIAKRLAEESVVLLKNDSAVLPLQKNIQKIAVIGPLAENPLDQMGTWAMDGRGSDVQTPLAALRAKIGSDRVLYAAALKNSRDTSQAGFADAVQKANASDVVLLFLGEEQILSGEAHSRAFLDLPGAQADLVAAIAKTGKPIVGIIMAGRPLTFHASLEQMKALLYAWHPGTMGGPAITDLLFGDSTPSGKLPITFPRTVGQVPVYYNHLNTGRPATEKDLGIPQGNPVNPTGYSSKYVDVDFTPEFPFGFGLSYTRFEYSHPSMSGNDLQRSGKVTASAEVANRGSRDADETVELYIHQEAASVSRPVKELKAFRRVHLKAGESTRVSFALTANDLAFYNEKMQFVTEPGKIHVWIGPDSNSGVESTFTVR
jgi:beta-glucosidase